MEADLRLVGISALIPFPSTSGCEFGQTPHAYDMLVKRALLKKARKDGSSCQDIVNYIRTHCDASEETIRAKLEPSLRRMYRDGYVYMQNKNHRRFKLTTKGREMKFCVKKKVKPQKRTRSRSVRRYPAKKKTKRSVSRSRGRSRTRSRSRSRNRSRSRSVCKPIRRPRSRSTSRKPAAKPAAPLKSALKKESCIKPPVQKPIC